MRIFTEQALKQYIKDHPKSKVALQEWITIVKKSKWNNFADIKSTFNSVDNVGNQHYVFNICLLYTSPSPRDRQKSRMPSSA